jgi:transposase
MNAGKTLLAQVMDFVPKYEFDKLVEKYKGNYKAQEFSCWEQYVCMAFAQLTQRESLRDIETCLRTVSNKLYHCGIKSKVAKSTLAYWNESRDWRIYAELTQLLIATARKLYENDNDFLKELDATVYAFDSTTIDLCLTLFPWAKFRTTKAAVKAHALLDLQGNIPSWIFITDGSVHDVNILDLLPIEAGAYYVMDKGYVDFERLYNIHQASAFWITRAKDNFSYTRQYSSPVKKESGIICDQTGILKREKAYQNYPEKIRRIKYYDSISKNTYVFITNNKILDATMIAALYKQRWQIELFFKWIKQHLKIKSFFGTSRNAVHTQIWIAVSVYVLIAIIKKRLNSEHSLYTLLQKLSVCVFEKMPIQQAFQEIELQKTNNANSNQLNLF